MSSIKGLIEVEHPELFALGFGKIAESDFVYTQHLQILTNQHQMVKMYTCDHKISDELDYGSNRTRTV